MVRLSLRASRARPENGNVSPCRFGTVWVTGHSFLHGTACSAPAHRGATVVVATSVNRGEVWTSSEVFFARTRRHARPRRLPRRRSGQGRRRHHRVRVGPSRRARRGVSRRHGGVRGTIRRRRRRRAGIRRASSRRRRAPRPRPPPRRTSPRSARARGTACCGRRSGAGRRRITRGSPPSR